MSNPVKCILLSRLFLYSNQAMQTLVKLNRSDQIYNEEHKALLKRTRSVYIRGCSTTFAFVGVIVIPGFQASMISLCSLNDLPFSSSGMRISYLRVIWERMQTPSVSAKRCPMQLRAPPEKALTKRILNTMNERGAIGSLTGVAGPSIVNGVDKPFRHKLCDIITPIDRFTITSK